MSNSKPRTTRSKIINLKDYKEHRVDKLKQKFRQKTIKALIKHAENYFPEEEKD